MNCTPILILLVSILKGIACWMCDSPEEVYELEPLLRQRGLLGPPVIGDLMHYGSGGMVQTILPCVHRIVHHHHITHHQSPCGCCHQHRGSCGCYPVVHKICVEHRHIHQHVCDTTTPQPDTKPDSKSDSKSDWHKPPCDDDNDD